MAKIKTITDVNLRSNGQIAIIDPGTYIEVTESMAVYLCNEDIEQLSLDEQKRNSRVKHAIRTPLEEEINVHVDYTHL